MFSTDFYNLISSVETVKSQDFKTKIRINSEVNSQLDSLTQLIVNCECNIREFGHIPQYRRQYTMELLKLQIQVEMLRESCEKVGMKNVTGYFPNKFPVQLP